MVFGLGLALSSYFVFCCWSQASGSVSGVGLGLDTGLGWLWEVGEREKILRGGVSISGMRWHNILVVY